MMISTGNDNYKKIEECYYNYIGINMFGKYTYEKYERK